VIDPTNVRALVLFDDAGTGVAFVTVDAIGMSGQLADISYNMAAAKGFKVPRENVIMSGSHTHSGPGALAPDFLWAVAPATDLIVPSLRDRLANTVASALLLAQNSMKPAVLGISKGMLTGVTVNRRGTISPWLRPDTIDPHLGVIRIDDTKGNPIATVWNFAIHGICYGPDNLKFSSDIMGRASTVMEQKIGGEVLFINADAGDMDPAPGVCNGKPNFVGANTIASAVAAERLRIAPTSAVTLHAASLVIPFGFTQLNITLARFENCTSGGTMDICTICRILDCDLNLQLNEAWIEQNPRFTAFAFNVKGKNTLMVTLPGEPLVELGWEVYNDTLKMGFDQTFLCGYSNNHLGYFATPNEYDIGGYESRMTFWGRNTAEMVRQGCNKVAAMVKPKK